MQRVVTSSLRQVATGSASLANATGGAKSILMSTESRAHYLLQPSPNLSSSVSRSFQTSVSMLGAESRRPEPLSAESSVKHIDNDGAAASNADTSNTVPEPGMDPHVGSTPQGIWSYAQHNANDTYNPAERAPKHSESASTAKKTRPLPSDSTIRDNRRGIHTDALQRVQEDLDQQMRKGSSTISKPTTRTLDDDISADELQNFRPTSATESDSTDLYSSGELNVKDPHSSRPMETERLAGRTPGETDSEHRENNEYGNPNTFTRT